MATVADIEPASLEVTPGQAEVFTLSVRNEGDDVEAYHLSAVDEAAEFVVIEPDTLLVHPGETGTATATITLEHTGEWSVGELIVRFHIVPAGQPDEFLVVEAIATIQSFSDVAAVLSPPAIQGRRRAEAEIAIANAGNAHAYADVSVSAGELAVSIDQAHAALPANSTESIDLKVRANGLLWRGDPVQHPFVVTVTPEDHSSISLEGTFTQLPLLPGWTFKALIGVAAALALLLVLWIGAAILGGLGAPAKTVAATPTETATSTPEPATIDISLTAAPTTGTAGSVATTLEVEVDGAPDDSFVAVAVTWPPELGLVDDACEAWVDPETEDELSDLAGQPRPGDECLIDADDASGSSAELDLAFTTPPQGFSGVVSAAATRLLTVDDGEAQTVESPVDPELSEAELPVETAAFPFWMDVEVVAPSANDEGTRRAVVVVHRTLGPEGTNEFATMAFKLHVPSFVEPPNLASSTIPGGSNACDAVPEPDICGLNFLVDDATFGDLREWSVPVALEINDDSPDTGLITAEGESLVIGDDAAAEDELAERIRSAAAPLLVGSSTFPVLVDLDRSQTDADVLEATIALSHSTFPATGTDDAERDGSRMIEVALNWSEGLQLNGNPVGCVEYVVDRRTCKVPGPEAGKPRDIELSFTIDDDAENVAVGAKGSMLTFAPAGDDIAGGTPPGTWPLRWIASDVASLDLD